MCMISEIAGPGDHFNLLQAAEMMGVAPKAAERFAFACRAASAIGVSGLDHSSTRPPTRRIRSGRAGAYRMAGAGATAQPRPDQI